MIQHHAVQAPDASDTAVASRSSDITLEQPIQKAVPNSKSLANKKGSGHKAGTYAYLIFWKTDTTFQMSFYALLDLYLSLASIHMLPLSDFELL